MITVPNVLKQLSSISTCSTMFYSHLFRSLLPWSNACSHPHALRFHHLIKTLLYFLCWKHVFETQPGWVGKIGTWATLCAAFNTSLAIGCRIASPQARQLRSAHTWQNQGCVSAKKVALARCKSTGFIGIESLQYCRYKLDDGLSWLAK